MKKQLPHCDVELTVTLISDRWKILILRDLLTGTKRFGELKKSVSGISQKVLTAHLRSMEEDGLVNRKIYAQIPPRVEYSLTETGWSLKPVLDAMAQWGETYRCKIQNLVWWTAIVLLFPLLWGGDVILFSITDCYVFRHVFVTRLLEFGYDVHIIKKRIGRSNVKTTMIYTHVLNRGCDSSLLHLVKIVLIWLLLIHSGGCYGRKTLLF